jgi:hypothetical protein
MHSKLKRQLQSHCNKVVPSLWFMNAIDPIRASPKMPLNGFEYCYKIISQAYQFSCQTHISQAKV